MRNVGLIVLMGVLGCTAVGALADEPQKRQIGELVLDGIPEWDDAVRERMLQYLNVRWTTLDDISDDGQAILIGTRFGETSQLHLVTQPLGMRRQITFFDEPVGGAFFVPGTNDRKIIYSKDQGGNEKSQFYLLDMASGQSTLLTDPEGRHSSPTMSRDGRYLAYAGTARNGRDFDIYMIDLASGLERKLLWQVEGYYGPGEFSPDGKQLLAWKYVSEAEVHWYIMDPATGEHKPLTPETPPTYYDGGQWTADGKAILMMSDRDGDFRKLYRYELADQTWKCIADDITWNVETVAVDPTGRGIAFVTNEDGISRLYFADEHGKNRKEVAGLPPGIIGGLGFAADGGTLGISMNSSRNSSDAFLIDYATGKVTRWTQSEVGGLNTDEFVDPVLIHYPTFDEVDGKPRTIPAFYYKAPGPGPHPVVIYAHGGPESQFRPSFASLFQYWINELGISVIAPNIRGSTGYGRQFHQLDNGFKREDSLKDIGALLDWIATQPELDQKRVGIFGGSYGGYVVLGSISMYPDRFKAAVDSVGIANFVTFLENTGEFRRDMRRAEYGDERDPEMRAFLEKISPTARAEQVKAALFVLHGKNDPRVPYTEAEQIVTKLRGLGRPVWYALALNEGHGFQKKENNDLSRIMYAIFWREHLVK
ncbi:MAG: S9 family peptidase [Phycisphaerae bacterium]|nr:S9 family peptidase [Phycisphaerae bacterium]